MARRILANLLIQLEDSDTRSLSEIESALRGIIDVGGEDESSPIYSGNIEIIKVQATVSTTPY